MAPRTDNNRKRGSKRIRLPTELPLDPHFKISSEIADNNRDNAIPETSTGLASLQHEARSAFRTSRAMPSSSHIVASSPESSLDSPDLHPFRVSSSGGEEARQLVGLSTASMAFPKEIPFSRSTSDGYEASGGEDSDQIPSRIVQRSTNWSSLLFPSEQNRTVTKLTMPSSSSAL
ncbi:putative protein S-acyltransferase 22 [Abeliophyllum distichum]|uniref:Uncharacterized protein n=1 Tax=Abeliophyllum distichum TaxID=126358 RepID=A0ABD1W099_9LAMI